ncbi:MAG: hypothetical protein QNK37_30595 [Acidobacteriota bacterium]|nr:hypothetical protein [Acidobacteriota bacterium]
MKRRIVLIIPVIALLIFVIYLVTEESSDPSRISQEIADNIALVQHHLQKNRAWFENTKPGEDPDQDAMEFAGTMARLCRHVAMKDEALEAYSKLKTNKARLKWLLDNRFEPREVARSRYLYDRFILPFPHPELEQLTVGAEHSGRHVLESFFLGILAEGKRQFLEAELMVAQISALTDLQKDAVKWLGIEKPHGELTKNYRDIIDENQEEIKRLEPMLAELTPEDIATTKPNERRQAVIDITNRILSAPQIAEKLKPELDEIARQLEQLYTAVSGEIPSGAKTFADRFALLGQPAAEASNLYRLTETTREVPLASITGENGIGLYARLEPSREINRFGRAGLVPIDLCHLSKGKDGLFASRRCSYTLIRREILATEEVMSGGKTLSRSQVLEFDTGIRFNGIRTRLSDKSPSGLEPLQPVIGQSLVALEALNAGLRQQGLPPFLEVIGAEATFSGPYPVLRLRFAVPGLSTKVSVPVELSLNPALGSLRKVLENETRDLARRIVERIDSRLAEGDTEALQPREPLPGLKNRHIDAVWVEPGPTFTVAFQHNAELLKLPVRVVSTLVFHSGRFNEGLTRFDPESMRIATLTAVVGAARPARFSRASSRLAQVQRRAKKLQSALAQGFADGLIDQFTLYQEKDAKPESMARFREIIAGELNDKEICNLENISLSKEQWLTMAEKSTHADIISVSLKGYTGKLMNRQEFMEIMAASGRFPPGKLKKVLKPVLDQVPYHASEVLAARLVTAAFDRNGAFDHLGENRDDTSVFYSRKVVTKWSGWGQWQETVIDLAKQATAARTALTETISPKLFQAVTLQFRGTRLNSRGDLETGLTVSPAALGDLLPNLTPGQLEKLVVTKPLNREHRDSLADAVRLAETVWDTRQTYRQESERLNHRMSLVWEEACRAHPVLTADEASKVLMRMHTPTLNARINERGIGLWDWNGPLNSDGGWVGVSPDGIIEAPRLQELTAPLRAFNRNEAAFWENIRPQITRKAEALAATLQTLPASRLTLQALAELKAGKTYAELTPEQRERLPAVTPLFEQNLVLEYRFRNDRLRLLAHAGENNFFGRPFRVDQGLNLALDEQGMPKVTVDWQNLSTTPSLQTIARARIRQLLPDLTVNSLTHTGKTLHADIRWALPGLSFPLEVSLGLDLSKVGNESIMNRLIGALKRHLEITLREGGVLPEIGPFKLTAFGNHDHCSHPLALTLKGIVTLDEFQVEVTIQTCPSRSFKLEVHARDIPVPNHPILKTLDVHLVTVANRGYSLENGLRLNVYANIGADLPGTRANLQADFYLDREGLHFNRPVTLEMNGWWDNEHFSLGNLKADFDVHKRLLNLRCSLTVPEGEESSKRIMLTLSGSYTLGDPELRFKGDLYLLRRRMANVYIVVSIPEQSVTVDLDTDFLLDLLELKGKVVIKNAKKADDKTPVLFARLEGEVLSVDLAKAQAEFTRTGAGYVWGEIGFPLDLEKDRLRVDFQDDYTFPSAAFRATKGFKGFNIYSEINANTFRVQLKAGAEIAGIKASVALELPTLKHVSLDQIIRELLKQGIEMNAPSSWSIVVGSTGIAAKGKKGPAPKIAKQKTPVKKKPPVPIQQTDGKPPWVRGWDWDYVEYKHWILKPFISEPRKRPVAKYMKGAARYFNRIGFSPQSVADTAGYTQNQGIYALTITRNPGKIHLFRDSGGQWSYVGWQIPFPGYTSAPPNVQLLVLNHKDSGGMNLAVLRYGGRILAVKSGATLNPGDPGVRDITDHLAGMDHFSARARNEIAWHIGYYQHGGGNPLVVPREPHAVFIFLGTDQYALIPQTNGEILLISFAVPGNQTAANLPPLHEMPYLKALKDLPVEAVTVHPPGPALLYCGRNKGFLFFRQPTVDEGVLWYLHGDGRSTRGTWQWRDNRRQMELDSLFRDIRGDRLDLMNHLLDRLPVNSAETHFAFRHIPDRQDAPFRVAMIYNIDGQTWLGFGDETMMLGGKPEFLTVPWSKLKEHWSNNQSLIPGNEIPGPRLYGDMLLFGNWNDKDHKWNADPAGPLKELTEVP